MNKDIIMLPKSELLSPAKDKETAIAAIDCGADAVYMGGIAFGARQNASNSLEDIKEVVNYAHKFWAKVYITVNTILDDIELDKAVELIKQLENIKVDAVIVQDMGLINRIKNEKIDIPIHISTQCDNRNSDKVSFFSKLGLSRVVLARELSISQIKEINSKIPDIELEAFVHGALCVSYSGQCYLSQYIGGRSANRGECAQPCRKKYSIVTEDGKILAKDVYALCLKDFNTSSHIKEMIDAGIFSFKIEGRLKEIGYVKNITAYYRNELDKYSQKISSGKSFYPFEPQPEKSFNRGFTDYFLHTRSECFNFISPKSRGEYIGEVTSVNKNCIIISTKKNIRPQDGLTFLNNGFLVNKVEHSDNSVKIFPNKKIDISVGTTIYRNYDKEFSELVSLPVKRQIGVKIIIDKDITVIDENSICIKSDFPSQAEAHNKEKMNKTFIKQFSKTGESDFYIENITINADVPFMPVSEINALRRKLFNLLMQKRLEAYSPEKQKTLNYTKFYKNQVDYRANVHNNQAKIFYEACGCDVQEWSFEKNPPIRQVELMRTKHCIKYALNMCKTPVNLLLKDEYGKSFPLKFDCKKCEMAILTPD